MQQRRALCQHMESSHLEQKRALQFPQGLSASPTFTFSLSTFPFRSSAFPNPSLLFVAEVQAGPFPAGPFPFHHSQQGKQMKSFLPFCRAGEVLEGWTFIFSSRS